MGTEPTVRMVVPEKLDLKVSLEGVPAPLLDAVAKLSQPASAWTVFVKDYVPVLTPIAALIVSVAVYYYTKHADERAFATASSETLSKLIAEFGPKTEEDARKGEKNGSKQEEEKDENRRELEERDRTIAAMKVAVHREQALPAVKMALGDADLREGGVLVAVQMYRAEMVPHVQLTTEMLSYYDNPVLRRGVLDWLVKMERQLSEEDARSAFDKLKQSFGAQGEHSAEQGGQVSDGQVSQEAANFLLIWHFKESKDLAFGLAKNCPANLEGAREQAVAALTKIASKEDRDSVAQDLQALLPSAPPVLKDKINYAITQIQKAQ